MELSECQVGGEQILVPVVVEINTHSQAVGGWSGCSSPAVATALKLAIPRFCREEALPEHRSFENIGFPSLSMSRKSAPMPAMALPKAL
jgi:hypothetical protein